MLVNCPNKKCNSLLYATPGVLNNCNVCNNNFMGPPATVRAKCPFCGVISEGTPNTVYSCPSCKKNFTTPKLTGGTNSNKKTSQCISCNKNSTTTKIKGGNNINQENLEEFINKISQNMNENSNPNNINVAISKLQLMYTFQNKDYKTLINKYSKLSDSYHKLIQLEKINKVPITSKPAILTMIDKLFINNLSPSSINEDDSEEDDLSNYSNIYNPDDENAIEYKNKKKERKIVKKIEYKLFDGLNLKNKINTTDDTNTVVAFNAKDGERIN